MNDEDSEIIMAMQTYGGSFVLALAELATRADPENLRRIKEAWPESWDEYKRLAKLARDRANKVRKI